MTFESAELYQLLNELRDTYKQLLYAKDKVVSGNANRLADNVTPIIEDDGEHIKCIFNLPGEWKYVEFGSIPHWPLMDKIKDWINQKPVVPRADSRGKVPSPEQLAFLVSRKIAISGIEPNPILEEAITQTDFYNRAMYIIRSELYSSYIGTLLKREIKEIHITL